MDLNCLHRMSLRACWNVVGGGERVLGSPCTGTGGSCCARAVALAFKPGSHVGAWPTHQVTPDHHWAHPCFSPWKAWGYGYQPGCAGQVGQGVNTQRLRGNIFHPGHRGGLLGKRGQQREAEMEEAAGGESKRAREREQWKKEGERAKQEKICTDRGCPGSGPHPGPSSAPPGKQMLLGLQVTLVSQPVPLSAG